MNSYLTLRDKNKNNVFHNLPLLKMDLFSLPNSFTPPYLFLIDNKVIDWENSYILIAAEPGAASPAVPGESFLLTVYYHDEGYIERLMNKLIDFKNSLFDVQR
jgi:hypothetical protein